MIEKDINEMIKNPQRLAALADEFREGRDIGDLLELLDSEDEEIVGIATWIAGEIRIDPEEAESVISRMHRPLDHRDYSIRFHAIGALYPFLDRSASETKAMLTRLSNDPEKGVRMAAQAALKRLGI